MSWIQIYVFSYDLWLLSWENTFSSSMFRSLSHANPHSVLVCSVCAGNEAQNLLHQAGGLPLSYSISRPSLINSKGFCCAWFLLLFLFIVCVVIFVLFDHLLLEEDLDWSLPPSPPLLLTLVSTLVTVTNACFFLSWCLRHLVTCNTTLEDPTLTLFLMLCNSVCFGFEKLKRYNLVFCFYYLEFPLLPPSHVCSLF